MITGKMKKFFIPFILLILAQPILTSAQETTENTSTLPEDTDLHYSGKYCSECHEKTPEKGGEDYLKFNSDFSQLCRCHGYTPGTYIHPVDIFPSEEKKKDIPDNFPLKDGKVSCTTCHDIYLQCQKNPRFKVMNRRFLRGAPYVSRTTLCFRCHDEKKYTMLDPHNQLTESGAIVVDKCLYCHVEKPDERIATFEQVKLIGNLEVLCFRCHFKQSQMHPINANHLVTPPPAIVNYMKETEKKFGIILPLNYDGKRCHPKRQGQCKGSQ
jgi:hypothetical protein